MSNTSTNAKPAAPAAAPVAEPAAATPSAPVHQDYRYAVTNRGSTMATVDIVVFDPESGKTRLDQVFVNPGGRPKLPMNSRVEPMYLRKNPSVQEHSVDPV